MADEEVPNPNTDIAEEVKNNVTKEKIPPKNIIEMLTNSTLREELMPLLKKVLDAISNIDGLDDAISNLLKEKQNIELTQALEALQKTLYSNYNATYGGKRRRTNKRKNYKKRRSTKHR